MSLLLGAATSDGAHAAPAFHEITGFRSARFGMTQAEVRAAIDRDFKPAPEAVTEMENPLEQTRVIRVNLARLEPGPTPAIVTYIVGAKSHKLIHVNVVWTTTAAPSDAARSAIAVAGVQLANDFRGRQWRPHATTAGARDPRRGLVLFAGIDPHNAAVEVRVNGVATAGDSSPPVAPATPAQLVVAYVADINHPDIATTNPASP